VLSSRMSLAQNSRPGAWLPGERASDLRESLRLPAGRQVLSCVILNPLSASPHRPPINRQRLPAAAGPLSAATSGAFTCNTCCKYPNFSDLLIMEHL
jgi:hypothetical protein